VIPHGGFTIKRAKIRGVESCGMLCSTEELGLGSDAQGILELPDDAPVGAPLADVMGLNDPVIDIAITPNRGDCLGVYGIARDLAAAGLGTLKPVTAPLSAQTEGGRVPITIRDTQGCAQFIGTVIRGVTNGPAPDWMQQRLKAVGLRPISALVDITNYINLTFARPLHVYDLSKLNGGIIVRRAEAGEHIEALNDKSYMLQGGECVIADEAGVLGLGGIVGGVISSVTEATTDILLECAWFDPARIAEAGRAHAIDTDARYRFERTVDPGFVATGSAIAAELIQTLCGGTAEAPVVAGSAPDWHREIGFDPALVTRLGGITIAPERVAAILQSLGFALAAEGGDNAAKSPAHDEPYTVTPPSWRPDIEGPADLVEEILRIHGYDAVAPAPLPKPAHARHDPKPPATQRQDTARRVLAGRGLHETHHWAFMDETKAAAFGFRDAGLKLVNPISSDLNVMRPSLIPHLLDAAVRNAARGFEQAALFEIGPQFEAASPGAQQLVACALRAGIGEPKQWFNQSGQAVSWLDAKADALAVLAALGVPGERLQVVRESAEWFHPGRSGSLKLGPKTLLARFGELHPLTLQTFACEQPVVLCEVFLEAVPASRNKQTALMVSDFQPVERDFAFVVDEQTPAQDLLRALAGVDKQLVQSVRLFDLYQGKGIEPGKKSLAITLRLQAPDRTLRDEEIEAVSKKVINAATKLGAQLRA